MALYFKYESMRRFLFGNLWRFTNEPPGNKATQTQHGIVLLEGKNIGCSPVREESPTVSLSRFN